MFGPCYLVFASCHAAHHPSSLPRKCKMSLYLAGARVVCVPFRPHRTCVVIKINGLLLVTMSPPQDKLKTRPPDILVCLQERSVSSVTAIVRERNIGISPMGKSVPLRSSVNPLTRILCYSTRDIKQHHSQLYQHAKTLRQGGTTPTSRQLGFRRGEWYWLLRQVKTSWSIGKTLEYARLLAAYHSAGDPNVPAWIHEVYRAMDM